MANNNERESRRRQIRSHNSDHVVEEEEKDAQLDFEGFTEFFGEISLHCQKQKEIYVCQL